MQSWNAGRPKFCRFLYLLESSAHGTTCLVAVLCCICSERCGALIGLNLAGLERRDSTVVYTVRVWHELWIATLWYHCLHVLASKHGKNIRRTVRYSLQQRSRAWSDRCGGSPLTAGPPQVGGVTCGGKLLKFYMHNLALELDLKKN